MSIYRNLKLVALISSGVALILTAAFVIAAPKISNQEPQTESQTRQPLSAEKKSVAKQMNQSEGLRQHSIKPNSNGISATFR